MRWNLFFVRNIFTTDGVKYLEKNTQMRVSLKLREQRLFCCDQHFDQRQEGITLELLLFLLLCSIVRVHVYDSFLPCNDIVDDLVPN